MVVRRFLGHQNLPDATAALPDATAACPGTRRGEFGARGVPVGLLLFFLTGTHRIGIMAMGR
jgi:hypothetical protein